MKRFLIGMAAILTGAAADATADGPKGKSTGGSTGGRGVTLHAGPGKSLGKPTSPANHTLGKKPLSTSPSKLSSNVKLPDPPHTLGKRKNDTLKDKVTSSVKLPDPPHTLGKRKLPSPDKATGGVKPKDLPNVPWKKHGGTGHKDYHLFCGTPFKGGFCYHGKHHCHWTYSCYSPKYGCNCYWCPSTCCYYYWCEPACCYYPISHYSYAPVYAAPVQTQSQVQILVLTQSQGVASEVLPGGPPPGVPPVPE